jgi:hypothetical protein
MRALGAQSGTPRETDQAGVMRAAENLSYPVACIWEPSSRGYGHASVFIQEPRGAFPEDDVSCYASLFPGEDTRTGRPGARKEHLGPGRKLTAEFNTFQEDCCAESEKQHGFRLPDHMIPLGQLDTLRMQAAWNALRTKPDAHYRLMRKNCSTVAARIVRAGMGTGTLALSSLLTHKTWWTPHDVLLLARSLATSDCDRRIGALAKALK